MADVPMSTRMIFIFHTLGCTAQLFMFTYSCDCIMKDSGNVATAMYATTWSYLPMDNNGRALRKDLILAILYSGVPCCLTAHKFFPVSLETYTGVMSTAVSYFTLLKQRTSETT
ncbi:odorant receptor 4-like [Hylaeus anthracinus]|uniref:odorant receptor 4-like n=2 Tax=Hylaeus anthracinus TaxID=313031 RepID=UPI0023B8C3EB|nr:odorant receptor 4-like [Hylaeus anthracinus]